MFSFQQIFLRTKVIISIIVKKLCRYRRCRDAMVMNPSAHSFCMRDEFTRQTKDTKVRREITAIAHRLDIMNENRHLIAKQTLQAKHPGKDDLA